MATDQIVIDGIDVNDQVDWSILAGSITFTPARKKLNWASSALGDGAALVGDEDHYENAEMVFTVRAKQQANKDAALGLVHTLTQKLQTARSRPGGIPLVWAPVDSSKALTFYIQDAEWDEIHTSKEGGWFDNAPELVCHLYLRPFGYGSEETAALGWSDPFAWDGITGGRWRFDSGSGTIAVSGGALVPSSTAFKVLYVPFTTADSIVMMRVKIGATITGEVGVILKRVDSSNYIYGRISAGTTLELRKIDGGVDTQLAGTSFTPSASTFYWLKGTIIGDEVNLSVYADAQNPVTTTDPTATATVSDTLTGGDETQFGTDIRGNLGIRQDPPATFADWTITDFVARGMEDVKSSEPLTSFEIPDVKGHVPAEGRIVVTEGGAKDQAHFEWGLESRDYVTDVVPPLILDSAVLSTTGYAGAQADGTNMYDPDATGNDQILSEPLAQSSSVAVCSTGSQLHTGSFKVKARVKGTAGVRLRLAWQAGVTPLVRNNYTEGILGVNVQEVDLGTVTIPAAGVGTQHWLGRVEAYSPETSNGTLQIDYLLLIPVERYGVARAPLQPVVADTFVARDGFNQGSATMSGAALDVGGNWTTGRQVGATAALEATGTNFTINMVDDRAERVAVSDPTLNAGRYAIAGTSPTHDYTNVQVQVTMDASANVTVSGVFRQGVIARYVDANNWLMAVREVETVSGALKTILRVYKRVAGTVTQIGEGSVLTHREATLDTVILKADVAGVFSANIYPFGATEPATPKIQGDDTALNSAGALNTGRVGIYDAFSTTSPPTRMYDSFGAWAANPPVVIYSGKTLEVRSDRAVREFSGGDLWGRVPQYRGDRFFVPPTQNGTISRLACKDRRLNVDEGQPDGNAFTDAITVQVLTTPRYLHPVGAQD